MDESHLDFMIRTMERAQRNLKAIDRAMSDLDTVFLLLRDELQNVKALIDERKKEIVP